MSFLADIGHNIAAADTRGFVIIAGGLLVFACMSMYWAFRYMIKARTLEDVPTSKARSAEQGYVELEGHAEMLDGPPVRSPLSGRECVWWTYSVERYRNNDWVRVEGETSDSLFGIRDDTGTCIVDPDGANVFPEHSRTWNANRSKNLTTVGSYRGSNYRYKERYILPHELICVIGEHKTLAAIDHWDDGEELRKLLADWKKNQVELINRFDKNDDGVLDQEEWDIAREEARKQLRAEKQRHARTPGVNVICAPPDRRPFLIATLHSMDFAKKLRWKALGSLAGAIVLAAILTYVASIRYGS